MPGLAKGVKENLLIYFKLLPDFRKRIFIRILCLSCSAIKGKDGDRGSTERQKRFEIEIRFRPYVNIMIQRNVN